MASALRSLMPMIRSPVVASVLASIGEAGDLSERLRLRHHISRECLENPYGMIPLRHYIALFEEAATACQDSLLGAHLGLRARPEYSLGPTGFLFANAATLRDALRSINLYISSWQHATEAMLHQDHNTAVWSYRISAPDLWPRRQDAEYTMMTMCTMIRSRLGQHWIPDEVHFEHDPPPSLHGLRAIFHVPLRFNQPANALMFRAQDLDLAAPESTNGFARYVERHVIDMLGDARQAERLSEQVRQFIYHRMGHMPITLSKIALEMGIPARSLQRSLGQENTSLRQITKEVRLAQAKMMLAGGNLHTSDIAQSLGYADSTAFWRAFKSWSGISPQDFAARHR